MDFSFACPRLLRCFFASPVRALLLLLLAGAGCGGEGGRIHDPYGAYNARGGAHRANDFSGITSPPVQNLTVVAFPSLPGGFMAPPLEMAGGRMVLLTRSDTTTMLAIVLRDSVLSRYTFPVGQYPLPMLAADSAGQIYAVTTRGQLTAIDMEGNVRWQQETFEQIAPDRIVVPTAPLALDDGVVVGTTAGRLMRFDRSGRQLWSIYRGASPGNFFAADPALGIVLGLTHDSYDMTDSVSVVDPATGAARWTKPLPQGRLVYGPVIIGNLIVVSATVQNSNDLSVPFLVAFRGDGTVAWRYQLLLKPRGLAGDAEGNIYISCAGIAQVAMGGALVSVDSLGKKRWEVNFESGVPAPPLVSAEWVYVITRNQGRTGLFTYGRDGKYSSFVSIHLQPDVLAPMTLSVYGEPIMVGVDQPVILRGG